MQNCDEEGIEAFNMRRLLPMISCLRCGRYRKARRWMYSKIQHTAANLLPIIDRTDAKSRSSVEDVSSMLRSQFVSFCRITCQHYRIEITQEHDSDQFADQITQNPRLVLTVLTAYERSVSYAVKQLEEQTEELI
jgi:hypothetical protein